MEAMKPGMISYTPGPPMKEPFQPIEIQMMTVRAPTTMPAMAPAPLVRCHISDRMIKGPKAEPKPAAKPASKPAAKPPLPVPAANGTHIAQLGSYASPEAAEAGWKVFQSRYANLKGSQPVITKANVDGKDYWRVAAGGFDRQGANAMCSAVKASGNGCIPIAQAGGNGPSGKSVPNKARLAKAD